MDTKIIKNIEARYSDRVTGRKAQTDKRFSHNLKDKYKIRPRGMS